MNKPSLRDYSEFGATLDRLKISFLSSVPSMWRMILRTAPSSAKLLKRGACWFCSASSVTLDQIIEWCGTDQVFNTYGMTETANWISGGLRPDDGKEGFVGTPWGGEFRVLRDGALQVEGQGEVAVASPATMLGLWGEYAKQPMMDGYLLTGDIGDLALDQTLQLIGRAKNEINVAGIKVLAEEVDMLLERHPDITEACAFAIPDEFSGERVGASVCLREEATATEQDMIGWCRTQARPQAVPHHISILESLPKTDRGKLDRQAIQKQALVKWH